MNLQTQTETITEFTTKMADTMLKKGNDYATDDRLSNFKLVAETVGISPEQVILVFLATKLTRLTNLISNSKTPANESISDSILDLANYAALLECLMVDQGQITQHIEKKEILDKIKYWTEELNSPKEVIDRAEDAWCRAQIEYWTEKLENLNK